MPSVAALRFQIESALAHKIPSALTPQPKTVWPVVATGIEPLDAVLRGGLPVGAITELVGPECSGRTSIAASFLSQVTRSSKVCAWIDVSNTFDPLAGAAAGLDLSRLLWVRCGVSQTTLPGISRQFALPGKYLASAALTKELHGGGMGTHPRGEIKGIAQAVCGLLKPETLTPRCAESISRPRPQSELFEASYNDHRVSVKTISRPNPWTNMEQAMRTADLLLQAGGFSTIVLDMASLAPEFVSRIPLATWHRYRLASQRTQSSILLLTQHPCAKSSAELLLRLQPITPLQDEATVFTGAKIQIEVIRQRLPHVQGDLVPLKKPSQSADTARWASRVPWAGQR